MIGRAIAAGVPFTWFTADETYGQANENARLRRQLARALGDQRSARTRSGNDPAP